MKHILLIGLMLVSVASFAQSIHHKPDTAKENAEARKQILDKYKSEIARMQRDMKRYEVKVKADSVRDKQPAKPKDQ